MNAVTFLPEIVVTVFFVAVFVLVYVMVWKTLRDNASLGRSNTAVLAFCVSVLCVLGVAQFIEWPGYLPNDAPVSQKPEDLLHWILIPYACLAIAVLLAQLLTLTSGILPDGKPNARVKKAKTKISVKTGNRRGRPRKQRPKEETSQNSARTVDAGPAPSDSAPASKESSRDAS